MAQRYEGGVPKSPLAPATAYTVNVSDDSHYMGALGAALFALERISAAGQPSHAPAKEAV